MGFSASNRCWTLEKQKKTKFKYHFSCTFYILYLILTKNTELQNKYCLNFFNLLKPLLRMGQNGIALVKNAKC